MYIQLNTHQTVKFTTTKITKFTFIILSVLFCCFFIKAMKFSP